jgi:hypothetical protein
MKLGNFFNLQKENLPGSPDWVSVLLDPLNSILYTMYTALTGNLTVGDNVVGQTTAIQVVTQGNYSSGFFTPIRIPWNSTRYRPQVVLVGKVEKPSNLPAQTVSVTVPSWTYDFGSQSISIPYIAGLADNSSYQITLLIM